MESRTHFTGDEAKHKAAKKAAMLSVIDEIRKLVEADQGDCLLAILKHDDGKEAGIVQGMILELEPNHYMEAIGMLRAASFDLEHTVHLMREKNTSSELVKSILSDLGLKRR